MLFASAAGLLAMATVTLAGSPGRGALALNTYLLVQVLTGGYLVAARSIPVCP